MAEANQDFNQQIIQLIEQKGQELDSKELPKLQENYRLHLTCIRNLFDALTNKNLITPDPYKKEKKISKIIVPENTEFSENERSVVLGIRCSDYETMIDFVCNYMRFSVSQLTMDKIRKLLELNATFAWNSLTENSSKPNTKALANCIKSLRTGAPPIILSLIKDTTHKSSEAINEINEGLKSLAEYQKEAYKVDVRRAVLSNPSFNKEKSYTSTTEMISEIKRLYASCMSNRPYNAELINEIALEETAPDKAERQKTLTQKFQPQKDDSRRKENQVDVHELLMEGIRVLGSLSDQFELCVHKIAGNHEILQSEHNSFKDRFIKMIRRMFNLASPDVEYPLIIIDKKTEAKRKEILKYNEFFTNLAKRGRYYASFTARHSPGYNRIYALEEDKALEFLNNQIGDCSRIHTLLGALDDYFKNSVNALDRAKIKGIKMELTAIKNILVKTNQYRAEYVAYREEQEQMKRLGITDV
ncbi:MAG: hypothetical protein J6Y93_02080 [Treponema sp.]|nr:hypothetical protein [Treponema sp.]